MIGSMGEIGWKVQKIKGYRFPGVIRSVFTTLKGETRYVVECTAEGAKGCLHIFSGDQLIQSDEPWRD